jgi:hypothetical protein
MPQLATRLTHPDIMSVHHSNYQLAPLHYAWHIGGFLGVLYWRPPRLAPKLLHLPTQGVQPRDMTTAYRHLPTVDSIDPVARTTHCAHVRDVRHEMWNYSFLET